MEQTTVGKAGYRTGCELWKFLSLLEVMGAHSQLCGRFLRGTRAKKPGDQAHSHGICWDEISCIFSDLPSSYDTVAIPLAPCEKRLHCAILATSSGGNRQQLKLGA